MFTVRLSDDLERRLARMARLTHRSKSDFVRAALEAYTEEFERMMVEAEQHGGRRPTVTEMDRRLGLVARPPKKRGHAKRA